MTTVDTNTTQLQEAISSLRESAAAAIQGTSAEQFEQFEGELNEFDHYCREVQQALWAEEARATIARLEAGDPLTPADQEVIRTFLISDAENYLPLENNFQDWVAELRRLMNEIGTGAQNLNRESIAHVRGTVKDAVRLVPDIRNYLEERRRIERCTVALDTLDAKSRELLVKILKEDLASPKR